MKQEIPQNIIEHLVSQGFSRTEQAESVESAAATLAATQTTQTPFGTIRQQQAVATVRVDRIEQTYQVVIFDGQSSEVSPEMSGEECLEKVVQFFTIWQQKNG